LSAVILALFVAPPARAESFQAWSARASRQEREKDDSAAESSYANALSVWKPSDGKTARSKAFCSRANLRDRRGDEAGALADLTDCLALNKKNAKAYHRRGQLRFKQGQVSSSIDDYYHATALNEHFGAAYLDRGRAYEKQGDVGFAKEDYARACGLGVKEACPNAKGLLPAEAAAAPPKSAPRTPPKAPDLPPRRTPRFKDCLTALQSCIDTGAAFSTCVGKSSACERKPVNGCCPGACLWSFRKRLNGGDSEAAAFRETFSASATCASH